MPPIDRSELLEWLRPEPPSVYEQECAAAIDALDFYVYSERLNLILAEAMEVSVRCGVSDLALAGDVGVGLYTPDGDLVACNVGSYLHVVSSVLPIKYIMRRLRNDHSVGVREGDIFFCNDPSYGSIHNSDQTIALPIFHEGNLLAWIAAAGHTSETGATEPGGISVRARTRFDEGMHFAPTRIGEGHQLRADLLQVMENYMSRSPRNFLLDLRARVSACERARRRLQELVQHKGPSFLTGLFRRVLTLAEQSARHLIRGWNDGVYRAVTFTDSIGVADGLQRVALTLTKRDDTLHFDFTGTSPEHEGSYHAFPHTAVAHAAIDLFGWPFHDLPRSTAALAPCTFTFPSGTVFSPRPDAAASNSVMICSAVMSLLPQCFARLMFDSPQRELVGAPMGNTGSGYVLAGTSQWGLPVSDTMAFPLNTEGGGGRVGGDGVDAMGFPWCPAGRAPNVEDEEHNYPIVCVTQKYARDSCGFGKHQGGLGTQLAVTPWRVAHLAQMSHSKNSRLHTTQGLFGGYPPRVIPGITIRQTDLLDRWAGGDPVPDDVHELVTRRSLAGDYLFTVHSRPTALLHTGDLSVEFSSGGAGYGDVLERDPESVLADLRQGAISPWVAEHVYRVAVDPDTLTVDHPRTAAWREAARAERCSTGLPYHRFLAEWSRLRPPENILRYYGRWPGAEPVRPVIRL